MKQYKDLPFATLIEKGDFYTDNYKRDSALLCFSLIYNTRVPVDDIVSQQFICKALNRAALIYFYYCDYKSSLELHLRAQKLCEEIGYDEYLGRILNNIGNIHYAFKEYATAKKYYVQANRMEGGSELYAVTLNNIGALFLNEKQYDSAMYYYQKSYSVRITNNDPALYDVLNNIAATYQESKQFDSVLPYFRAALLNVNPFNRPEKEAKFISNIGKFYFELNQFDSAKHYLFESNKIAEKGAHLDILSENFLYLSRIERKKGNLVASLDFFQKHSDIKDSVFNATKYGDINQLQFLYNMSKLDKQIQDLNAEQEMNEQTIKYQRTIQVIFIVGFLFATCFFVIIYFKNKSLKSAYELLVEKNIEIINYDEEKKSLVKTAKKPKKYKSSSLSDSLKVELQEQILEIMSNDELICSHEFSLNKLAELVGSNQTYVSQVINDSFEMNFKRFVNGYRIKIAQRLMQHPEFSKYKLDSICEMVGFEARNSFDDAFKEFAGVSPSFYARSLASKIKIS